MRVGVAYVDVRVNTTQFRTDLNNLENLARGATTRVNAELSKMGVGLSSVGTASRTTAAGMDQVATAATRQSKSFTGLLPHVAAVTASYMAMRTAWRGLISAIGAGVEFEQKMSAVKAITRSTEESFQELTVTARTMAAQTVFTATETAEALRYLAMAGFSVRESIAALPGVLNLALIGQLELQRATDIATDTLRAFGMEASDLDKVVDVFTATITRTNTNIEMMGQSMKFAAPVAKSLGYEIESVAAMIGILSQSGIKAGIAGRTLQQAFIRTMDAARGLGLEVGSKLIDVLKAYNKQQAVLEGQIGKVAAQEKIAMQIKKDYGLIALKSILVLKDNIDAYEKLEEAARKSSGETQRAVDIMMQNVDSAWKLVKSAVQEISINIFSEYGDTIRSFLEDTAMWFRENKDGITELATGFITGISSMIDIIGSIGTPLASLFRHLWDILSISDSLPPHVIGAGGIGMIAWILGGPVLGGVALGIAGVDAALRSANLSIGDLWNYADEKISNWLIDIARGLAGLDEPGQKASTSVRGVIGEIDNLNDTDVAAWGNKWAEAASDFQSDSREVSNHFLVMKASAEEFASAAPDVKKAFFDALALEEYKLKTEKFFAGLKPYLVEKYGDAAGAAMKAGMNAMIKEYKAAVKEAEKAVSDHEKFVQKTNDMIIKDEGDKYDVLIKAAEKHRDDLLKILKDGTEQQKKILIEAGLTEEKIIKDTIDRTTILRKQQIEAAHDAIVSALADIDKMAVGVDKKAIADMKAVVDAKKDLLKQLTIADTQYFDLKKQILDEEYAIAMMEHKTEAEAAALTAAYHKASIELMKEKTLAHGSMLEGMIIGLQDYQEQAQITWGEQGYKLVTNYIGYVEDAFKGTFKDAIHGNFDDIGKHWSDVWDKMVDDFENALIEMAAKWAVSKLIQILTGQGEGTFLGSIGGIISKITGVGGEKESIAGAFGSLGSGLSEKGEGTLLGSLTGISDSVAGDEGSILGAVGQVTDKLLGEGSGTLLGSFGIIHEKNEEVMGEITYGSTTTAEGVCGLFSKAFGWIGDAAVKLWGDVKGGFVAIWNWVSNATGITFENVKIYAGKVWDWISEGASKLWNWLTSSAGETFGGISGAASGLWDWISSSASSIWNFLSSGFSSIISSITSGLSSLWDWISKSASGVWDWLGDGLSSILSGMTSGFGSMWDWITEGTSGVFDWLGDGASSLWDSLSGGFSELFGDIGSSGSDLFGGVGEAAKSLFNFLGGGAEKIYNSVADAAGKIFRGIAGSGSGMFDSMVSAARKTYNSIVSILSGGGGSAGDIWSGGGIGGVDIGGIAGDIASQILSTGRIDVGATINSIGSSYVYDQIGGAISSAVGSILGGSALSSGAVALQTGAPAALGSAYGAISGTGAGAGGTLAGGATAAGYSAMSILGPVAAAATISQWGPSTLGPIAEAIGSVFGMGKTTAPSTLDWTEAWLLGVPSGTDIGYGQLMPETPSYYNFASWIGASPGSGVTVLRDASGKSLIDYLEAKDYQKLLDIGYLVDVTGTSSASGPSADVIPNMPGKQVISPWFDSSSWIGVEDMSWAGEGAQSGGVIKSVLKGLGIPRGEDGLIGVQIGEGVVSRRGMKTLDQINTGEFANSIRESIKEAFSEFVGEFGSEFSSQGGGDLHLHVKIDGKEIGYAVAKQYRSNFELIEATKRVTRKQAHKYN